MKKKLLAFITLFATGVALLGSVSTIDAHTLHNKDDINMVILFTEDKIDNDIKEIVTKSGGKIVKEIKELGGIEVECSPELIPEIKNQEYVESLSPSHIIKIEKKNNDLDSSMYYKNENNSYYKDEGNNYYEDMGSSYYEDTGSSYYEDNSKGYYNGENVDTKEDEEDIFDGNLYEKYQWDIKRVTNNGESFSKEFGNHNIIVGIVDSGVDTDHPDLKKNFLGGKNLVPKDFQDDESESGEFYDIEDRFGHGTEVTGQIAANGRIKGVAPEVGFKSYRVFDKYGQTSAAICADAIINAVNDNVDVINLSFGAYYIDGQCTWTDEDTGEEYDLGNDMADYTLLEKAIDYAVKNGVVVVTATGNEGLDCSDNEELVEVFNDIYSDQGFSYTGLMYFEPSGFEGVINVSATDKDDKIASYSNYGEGFINISAPGGDYGKSFDLKNMCITTYLDDGYTFDVGTSLSAPKVSGAVALIIAQNKNINLEEVEKTLYENAVYLGEEQYYGAGLLDINSALKVK